MLFRRSSKPVRPEWLDDDDDFAPASTGRGRSEERGPRRVKKHRRRNPIASFLKGGFSFVFLLFRVGFLGALVFCIAAGASFYLLRQHITGSEEAVPNLLGMTIPDAMRSLNTSSTLSLKLEGEEFSDMVKEGEITSQVPPSNSRVKAGSTVRVRVSRGNSMVQCPDLQDLNYTDAVIKLHEAGLKEGNKSTLPDPKVRKDCVISSDPPAGMALQRQSAVNLLVSLGPPRATMEMPDFTNNTVVEARAVLLSKGLQMPKVTDVVQPGTDDGVIVRQSPAAKSPVSPDDAILLTVVNNLGTESPTPEPEPAGESSSVPPIPGSEPRVNSDSVRPATPRIDSDSVAPATPPSDDAIPTPGDQ